MNFYAMADVLYKAIGYEPLQKTFRTSVPSGTVLKGGYFLGRVSSYDELTNPLHRMRREADFEYSF